MYLCKYKCRKFELTKESHLNPSHFVNVHCKKQFEKIYRFTQSTTITRHSEVSAVHKYSWTEHILIAGSLKSGAVKTRRCNTTIRHYKVTVKYVRSPFTVSQSGSENFLWRLLLILWSFLLVVWSSLSPPLSLGVNIIVLFAQISNKVSVWRKQ